MNDPTPQDSPTPITDESKWKTPLGDWVVNAHVCAKIEDERDTALARVAELEAGVMAHKDVCQWLDYDVEPCEKLWSLLPDS